MRNSSRPHRDEHHRDQRGAAAVEVVLLVPVLVVVMCVTTAGWRLWSARTALTGAWTAIANIGPVWGPEITANGSIAEFPDSAKWLMTLGMYLGRLELVSVLVLLLPRFWRG